MVVKLAVSRTQWAVGNGFFHSGQVATTAGSLHYFYDCGALHHGKNQDALTREVTASLERTTHIDLLFLSHFDYDHVSGLPALLAGATVDRIFIPLVPAAERLMTFARDVREGSGDLPDGLETRHEDLIIDPAGALATLAGGQNQPATVTLVDPMPKADVPLVDVEAEAPDGLTRAEIAGAQFGAQLKLEVQRPRVTASVGSAVVWEWVTFVPKRARKVSSVFVQALEDLGVIDSPKALQQSGQLTSLVREHKAELVKAYDVAVKQIGKSATKNATTLMLYSGPPPGSRLKVYRARATPAERPEFGAWDPRAGWLGLGDADLRAKARREEVNSVFRSRKPLVGTFAPSHHGSRRDWNIVLHEDFDSDPKRLPAHVFGASGAYGHPHAEVLRDVNEAGATAVVVGVGEPSRWTEAFSVYVGS